MDKIENYLEALTKKMVEKGIANKSDAELIIYGLNQIVRYSLYFSCLLLFGFLLNKVTTILVISLLLIPLRITKGGLHFSNDLLCMLVSVISIFFSVGLSSLSILMPDMSSLILGLLIIVYLLNTSILSHESKPINEKELMHFTTINRFIIVCYGILLLASYFFHNSSPYKIILSVIIVYVLTFILGRINNSIG